MVKDVSVVFRASDRVSADVKKIKTSVRSLEDDVKAYQRVQKKAFEEKAEVKLDIEKAKNSIKELKKEIRKGREGAEEDFRRQQEALEMLNVEYERLTSVQREAARAEKELRSQMQKTSNATSGGLFGDLAKAGLGNMLGGAVGDLAGSMVTSVFGSAIGDAIGSISGNAISGAAIGSMIAPGIGTAIGAGVGALTGGIQSLTEHQNQMDDLYRAEVQSLHTDAITDMDNKIASGSATAASREMYQKGFKSILGEDIGADLYKQLKAYGDTTMYDTTAMLGKGKEMLTYGIDGEDVMEMTKIIGDIAGGNTNNFSGLAYAISQSMAAGKLNAQDKNQMINYGFNPLEFVAKLQGVSVADATKMMGDGQISSDMLMDALRLAVSEGERFHNNANAMSDTYEGMKGQLDSAWSDVEAAAGEGFNTKRKEGMEKELEALNGELGEKMKAAYEMAGAYEAELENQHQQMLLKAMEDTTKRIEEQGLTGIEAEKVMWEAKTQAEIDYKNSEEYQMKAQAEVGLVGQIQQYLTEEETYLKFGQEMAQQFSKGWRSGRLANVKSDMQSTIEKEGVLGFINGIFANNYQGTPGGVNGHATGLQYVPYDGYIAKLHEGERVLTRQEARQGTGKSITVTKLADQIIVREEADIDKLASKLVVKLMDAEENFVGV